MSTPQVVTALVLLGLAGLAAAAFLVEPAPRSLTRVAVVVDRSATAAPDQTCADLRAIAAGLEGVGDAVELAVWATGDGQSAQEPVQVTRVEVARQPTLLKAGADRGTPLVDAVGAACGDVGATQESPIFAAVDGALADLRASGCDAPGTTCRLVVRTDGLEEVDRDVARRLWKGGEASEPRLENGAVEVRFCGLSTRSVVPSRKRLPGRADVERAWRAEFTHPASVTFIPSCDGLAR